MFAHKIECLEIYIKDMEVDNFVRKYRNLGVISPYTMWAKSTLLLSCFKKLTKINLGVHTYTYVFIHIYIDVCMYL